jgi:Na+/proline symporter
LQVPILLLMYATGIFLVAYYSYFLGQPGFAWIGGLHDPNRVMVHFISHGLPGTLAAIVLAGLFSGTMSSFSAGLNSLSTATYVDFIKRFVWPAATPRQAVRIAKMVTCAWGLLVMAAAAFMGGSDTILVIFAKATSPFAGPLLGIFLLGMLSRRVDSFGVMVGAIAGGALTVVLTYCTPLNWMWYFVVGSMTCVLVGYLLSLIPRGLLYHQQTR